MANNTKILKFNSGTEYDFRPFVNCTTEASTAIKSISLTGFTLFTGATIIVKFTKGNTAKNMSLSINGSNPVAVDFPVTNIGTYEFLYDGQWRNLTSGPNSDIKYFEYYFETNEIVSYLKIADLSDWEVTNFSNHYLIGNIYGNRGENANDIIVSNANLNCTGIYNITAIVSSYYDSNKPNTDYSQYYTHQLYINSTANLFEINTDGKAKLIEPCIIEHNGTKWLALKKVGSSCYIRFTGLMNGILPQDQWEELSQTNCSEYATANYTDGYAITTEKYYDGNQINTLLHSNNYDEIIKTEIKPLATGNKLVNNSIHYISSATTINGFIEPPVNEAYTYTIVINGISPSNVKLPDIKWAGGNNPINQTDAGIYEIIINSINYNGTIIYTGTWAKYE